MRGCRKLQRRFCFLLLATSVLAWGQLPAPRTPAPARELDSCQARKVTTLPGSHRFASDFIEAMAGDPDPRGKDGNAVWALTADLSDRIPIKDRGMYISKSIDGGETWIPVARVDSRYFDAEIGEGLRNGLAVSAGGADFVITTQKGAFQVLPRSSAFSAVVKSVPGPRVPRALPWLSLPKVEGDPVKGDVVQMAPGGKSMIVGYGYFDLNPQIVAYRRDRSGSWVEAGSLPHLPTEMDILSMQLKNSGVRAASSLYVGTGDQAYRINLGARKWTRITGVGPDSAIHGMSLVGGPHLAACWGVYNPLSADAVERVTQARFLLHRAQDVVGPNIRAYGIEVDASRPVREIVTAITGVYVSGDSGKSWRRINALPEGEFRSAHFNPDGTVIVSGFAGTFLVDPFSRSCSPHLQTRDLQTRGR